MLEKKKTFGKCKDVRNIYFKDFWYYGKLELFYSSCG